jgi:hypothetical protein
MMASKRAVVLFVFLFNFAISCKPQEAKVNVIESKIEVNKELILSVPFFISNNQANWVVKFIGAREDPNIFTCRFESIDGDTLKNMICNLDKYHKPIAVIEYSKKYRVSELTYFIQYDSKDTLYAYTESETVRKFIRGEYAYKNIHMGLDYGQKKFYKKHQDSLKRLRGSNLPDLPKN